MEKEYSKNVVTMANGTKVVTVKTAEEEAAVAAAKISFRLIPVERKERQRELGSVNRVLALVLLLSTCTLPLFGTLYAPPTSKLFARTCPTEVQFEVTGPRFRLSLSG